MDSLFPTEIYTVTYHFRRGKVDASMGSDSRQAHYIFPNTKVY
jgi:hypothetical protein